MRLTRAEYESLIAKNPRLRPCASNEEQQDADKRKVDNKARKTGMDEKGHPQFKLTVTILVSDNRRRDIDGALSTLLDCLIAAGRQLAMDTRDSD